MNRLEATQPTCKLLNKLKTKVMMKKFQTCDSTKNNPVKFHEEKVVCISSPVCLIHHNLFCSMSTTCSETESRLSGACGCPLECIHYLKAARLCTQVADRDNVQQAHAGSQGCRVAQTGSHLS